ncbi:DoxX family protein [Streptomyces sp. VRA16 Mangrove soil]|uniref:DoxX family protein n=1 Tax=Streptomyces sp. VRA16 Mangrove soil TaxID=2817434 RepID=UPI001A9FC9B5|nr:DoxX family protein [Streptomyces sp. VRA16 Mangrove soil]MBO1336994.1 DoxX family protein [Streptomyces sp. VRA16 Mangrove soil]
MNVALWITAVVLAAVCLVGSAKMVVPQEKLAEVGASAQWVLEFRPGTLKAIGAVELLAAVGLILPAAVGVAPALAAWAAAGLVALFGCAITMRLRRGERFTIAGDVTYLVLAALLAWGRFGPESFTG